jgi:hypothetical protein
MRLGFNKILLICALLPMHACNYPNANPGEPDSQTESTRQGAQASDLQVPRSSKLLKCLCSDIVSPSSRTSYPVIASETMQRQERCSFLAVADEASEQRTPYLEIKVARVLTQNSYVHALNRWRSRLPLNLTETESKPAADDVQTVIEGGDGDYQVRAIAIYKAQSGILITTEENAPKDTKFTGAVPPNYFTNVVQTYQSLCE